MKTISKETTFSEDVSGTDAVLAHLWRLAEQVSARAKSRDLAGRVVTLKYKRPDFTLVTRRRTLPEATQMADRIWREAASLLRSEGLIGSVRLVGTGLADLVPAVQADRHEDLLDAGSARQARMERVTDVIRARFGSGSIMRGRGLG